MIPIEYNASVYAFCSKSRRITRDVKPSIVTKLQLLQVPVATASQSFFDTFLFRETELAGIK